MSAEGLHKAVMELLAEAEVRQVREDAEHALGWVVLSIDQEHPIIEEVFGVFATPEEALIWADEHKRGVESGLAPGEPGWTVTVVPLLPVVP